MVDKKSHKYALHIYWSQDDEVFVVDVPDLPGCISHGDTPAEAAANAQDAVGLWIDTAREFDREIPPPCQSVRSQ
jgi:predicted RNase H-like HicB family nuclease